MPVPERIKILAAVASASALVLGGGGVASAQGSLGGGGSVGVVPVFDSESEGSLSALGEGEYRVDYTNRSGQDLACIGFVLPEEVSRAMYESLRNADYTPVPEPMDEWPEDGDEFEHGEWPEDGDGGGDEGNMWGLDAETQEALDEAMENGNFAFVIGEDGLTLRQLLKAQVLAQIEEGDEVPSEEELDEYVDALLDSMSGGLQSGLVLPADDRIINFVDDEDSVNWTATMPQALAEGERAGGVVACFDGFGRDVTLADTTYLEIEHADETTGPGGGGDDDDDEGTLPSNGIFGSVERILSSAS